MLLSYLIIIIFYFSVLIMSLQEEFDEEYGKYMVILNEQMMLVSQLDKGEKTGTEVYDEMCGMEIAKFPSKDRMEELLEDMPEGGIDISEMKGRFDYVSELTDSLFDTVHEKLPDDHFVKKK